MSNRIFEEAPEQQPAAGGAGAKAQLEKQARQLAYDTKYKVKQSLGKQTNLNPAQVSKAYLTQLAKSTASPAVKALAKKKLVGEEYLADVNSLVEKTINNVLNKVFVEGIEEEVDSADEYLNQLNEMEDKKYKIVVTDKSTGNKYRRLATRAKISELRANPNIASVEMTEYGEVSKSEKETGAETAKVKSGKKNDGNLANNYPPYDKVTRGDVIAGAKGQDQMGGKKKVRKEEFIREIKKEDEEPKVEGLKKGKKNKVKLFPEVSEQASVPVSGSDSKNSVEDPKKKQQTQAQDRIKQQEVQILQRKLQALRSAPKGTDPSIMASYELEGDQLDEKITAKTDMGAAIKDFYASKSPQLAGRTKKQRREAAIAAVLTARRGGKKLGEECGCEDEKSTKLKKGESAVEDPRGMATKVNMVRNKFRAMGLKMSYEPEGEFIEEMDELTMRKVEARKKIFAQQEKERKTKSASKRTEYLPKLQKAHYEPEGEVLGEEDPCWKGYTQVGMKKKNGREVPNCVPSKGVPKAKGYKKEQIEVEGEVLDERRREEKGTPRKPRNPAFELVAKSMGAGRMGVQPRGQKKVPGEKKPSTHTTPAQKVAKRRDDAQRAKDMMHSRFD